MDLTITIAFGLSLFAVAALAVNLVLDARKERVQRMLNRMIEIETR